jgi:hypothetical protein
MASLLLLDLIDNAPETDAVRREATRCNLGSMQPPNRAASCREENVSEDRLVLFISRCNISSVAEQHGIGKA